jgi:hypothetical protein
MKKEVNETKVKFILRILAENNLLTRQLIYAISAIYDIDSMVIVKREEYSYSYETSNKG